MEWIIPRPQLRGEARSSSVAQAGLPELPTDLALMKGLASQLDNLSIYRRGRSAQVLRLCDYLNHPALPDGRSPN